MESKHYLGNIMYVICDQCEDVHSIFECKKVWSNDHRERYPRYVCDICRNEVKEPIPMPENRGIYAI